MVRDIPRFLRIAGALLLTATVLHAQASTGRIEGQIRDSAGSPLPEVQVFVVGTAFGALSDPRGHYFIDHVPPATYDLRAAYVGYQPVTARNLRVLTGQTVIQDFALEVAPVVLHGIEVVGAENPLVPRDEVATTQRVQGEVLDHLPIDRLNDVLALQPGIVASGNGGPLALSIRGSRADEAVTYVDGVPVTPGYRGLALSTPGTQISVSTNAVEEVSITTGAASAEYGNAQSGVISLVTRSGGSRLSGALAYQTDEPFGVHHSLGFNRIEANVGGPLIHHLTWFVGGVLEGQRSAASGRDGENAPIFVPAGIDTTRHCCERHHAVRRYEPSSGLPVRRRPGEVVTNSAGAGTRESGRITACRARESGLPPAPRRSTRSPASWDTHMELDPG